MTFYNEGTPGRYEQACGAGDINMSAPVQQEQHEAIRGMTAAAPQGLHTITIRGVQVTVDPTVFDDFELLESLAEVQRGDVLALRSRGIRLRRCSTRSGMSEAASRRPLRLRCSCRSCAIWPQKPDARRDPGERAR